jgi:hypothetical protein
LQDGSQAARGGVNRGSQHLYCGILGALNSLGTAAGLAAVLGNTNHFCVGKRIVDHTRE